MENLERIALEKLNWDSSKTLAELETAVEHDKVKMTTVRGKISYRLIPTRNLAIRDAKENVSTSTHEENCDLVRETAHELKSLQSEYNDFKRHIFTEIGKSHESHNLSPSSKSSSENVQQETHFDNQLENVPLSKLLNSQERLISSL